MVNRNHRDRVHRRGLGMNFKIRLRTVTSESGEFRFICSPLVFRQFVKIHRLLTHFLSRLHNKKSTLAVYHEAGLPEQSLSPGTEKVSHRLGSQPNSDVKMVYPEPRKEFTRRKSEPIYGQGIVPCSPTTRALIAQVAGWSSPKGELSPKSSAHMEYHWRLSFTGSPSSGFSPCRLQF